MFYPLIAHRFRPQRRRLPAGFQLILLALVLLFIILFLKACGETEQQRSHYLPAWSDLEYKKPNITFKWLSLPTNVKSDVHPIDTLIERANKTYDTLLLKQTYEIETTAAQYRLRRGRHPPPGFDTWFQYAQQRDAVIVEDFFDQIYHDLGPFWGLSSRNMRAEARKSGMVISIRNGKATADSEWFWTKIWLDMLQTIAHLLPDMDLPLNPMDEPRLVVPWEEIDQYMAHQKKSRILAPKDKVKTNFTFNHLLADYEGDIPLKDKHWENTKPYWSIAVRGCHPESLARKAPRTTDFDNTPIISMDHAGLHTLNGYVSNYTLSTDFCNQPDLQSLHGALIEPLSVSASAVLFPLFGGSKLAINNEILLPAPMYWNDEERFTGGSDHGIPWQEKENKVIWRGVATGGKNRATNWKGFQRHRFVAMINATQAGQTGSREKKLVNWELPTSQYHIKAQDHGTMGEWISTWSDAAFTDLNCEPAQADGRCNYTDPFFSIVPGMSMSSQFRNKYLPDIDGNSFSGRYRGFLLSTSLPIKATIFREWHDSRLVPWKHFVPMDNRFVDFFGIMEYFAGYGGDENKTGSGTPHDAEAETIATEGKSWAERVLRKEDMQIYVLRLLLEYARLCDDERDHMGYVADLM